MSDIDVMLYVDITLALIIVVFLVKSLIDEDIRMAKKISEILKKYENEADNDNDTMCRLPIEYCIPCSLCKYNDLCKDKNRNMTVKEAQDKMLKALKGDDFTYESYEEKDNDQ